ncbi:MAG TPA: RNA 2',3'-cyclic phosphodiesterase [Kofleriaceae bacterium]|nr:RNA 2',3'-cyclic phosphodiesterase [Kofleriaceae bacterium]
MGDGIRLFIGVPVAASVAGELAGTCESLARRATTQKVAMRWLAPAAYHVTLRYLGWTRRETVSVIERAMQKAVAQAATGPLRFRCERLGAFASPARASVVWAGVEDHGGALAALAAALEREVVPLGFQAEKRAFHPHVTIARLREPTRVDQVLLPFAEQVFSETRCDSLTLFESLTKPSGSEYREVLRVPLSGTNSAVQRQSEPVQTGPLDASPGSDDGWK